MTETRECDACYWIICTCDEGMGFCEEHEKLVRNDEKACDSYMSWRNEIGGMRDGRN